MLTAYDVQFITDIKKRYVKETILHAKNAETDNDKPNRLIKQECVYCYYIGNSRVGGCAMTEAPCSICEKVIMYGSTCTNKVCLNCAKLHNLCTYCGADIELRIRRTKFDWIK